jgi:pimeloyl-ACP methyl ester carboxylesterase
MRPILATVVSLSLLAGAAGNPAPLGKLVDAGGYRLHLYCSGKGGPTVLLSAGAGDFSFDWYLVQRDTAKFVRVCSYDRAGQAWSEPGPQPSTMHQEAHDVRAALAAAQERGPYLLVGHSLGGLVMRIFANMYPNETGGVILVDATSPDTKLGMNGKLVHMRELAKPGPLPEIHTIRSGPPQLLSVTELAQAVEEKKKEGERKVGPPFDVLPPEIQRLQVWAWSLPSKVKGGDTYFAEELNDLYQQLASNPRPLGSKPVISIVGLKFDPAPPGVAAEEWKALNAEKVQQKRAYKELSTDGEIIEDANAGHHVHLDDPGTVVTAIRKVVTKASLKH